jgi:hypothetical protein
VYTWLNLATIFVIAFVIAVIVIAIASSSPFSYYHPPTSIIMIARASGGGQDCETVKEPGGGTSTACSPSSSGDDGNGGGGGSHHDDNNAGGGSHHDDNNAGGGSHHDTTHKKHTKPSKVSSPVGRGGNVPSQQTSSGGAFIIPGPTPTSTNNATAANKTIILLHVIKVVRAGPFAGKPEKFTITCSGSALPTPSSGNGSFDIILHEGSYKCIETSPHPGYDVRYSDACSGDITTEQVRAQGISVDCTVENDPILVINKIVNGGPLGDNPEAFRGDITCRWTIPPAQGVAGMTGTVHPNFNTRFKHFEIDVPGDFSCTENMHAGYGPPIYSANCDAHIIDVQQTLKACTITNNPVLHVVKKVFGGIYGGRDDAPSKFIITCSGSALPDSSSSFRGSSDTNLIVHEGSYGCDETSHSDYYYPTLPGNNPGCAQDLRPGFRNPDMICTISNYPILDVNKTVIGGPFANDPAHFMITCRSEKGTIDPLPSTFSGSGSTHVRLFEGAYRCEETGPHEGYTVEYSDGCHGTVKEGDPSPTNCVVTNRAIPSTAIPSSYFPLKVIKVVNGGPFAGDPAHFTIKCGGGADPTPSSFQGHAGPSGTLVELHPTLGHTDYRCQEVGLPYAGYTSPPTYSAGCSASIINADHPLTSSPCVITNNSTTPTANFPLKVIKVVNGGPFAGDPAHFTIKCGGGADPTPSSFQGHAGPSGTLVELHPTLGHTDYRCQEVGLPYAGYTSPPTYSAGCIGMADHPLTSSPCVITNNYNSTNTNITTQQNRTYSGGKTTTTTTTTPTVPSCSCQNQTVNSDIEIVRLDRTVFGSHELRPLVDVGPSYSITGGHVDFKSPSNDTKLVAAEIVNNRQIHAVLIDPAQTLVTPNKEGVYHKDLSSSFSGINPFTGKTDTVNHFTDLLIYNNGTSNIEFKDDDQVAMTISYNAK